MEEISQLITLSKELILKLDQYRGKIDVVPDLIKELNNVEKVFIKIDLKMTEDELVFNLNRNFMAEANSCLSLLRETLTNLNNEMIIFEAHNKDTFLDSVWNIFNQSHIHSRFSDLTRQIHDLCDHLLINFLPILNTIITESFEREKIIRPLQSLTFHDKEKIRTMLFTDNYIVKVYVPKGHVEEPLPSVAAESTLSHPAVERRVSLGGQSASLFDAVHDYYHIKWLQVLPHIWAYYPELTLGQIKYIYLTHAFFLFYSEDATFVNEKTVEECAKLQLYLEMTEEIPIFKQPDYEFIASCIHENKDLTMKQLIELLNTRFSGKREFTFLMLLSCELFSTRSLLFEKILRTAIDEFPAEEAQWPEGYIGLDWKVLHVIFRKHQMIEKISFSIENIRAKSAAAEEVGNQQASQSTDKKEKSPNDENVSSNVKKSKHATAAH